MTGGVDTYSGHVDVSEVRRVDLQRTKKKKGRQIIMDMYIVMKMGF